MTTGKELAKAGCKFLGELYSTMDCQTFVEKALAEVGIRMDLKGSNAWLREVIKNGWVGSPEECKKKFGSVPDGCFLFIHAYDGGEESRGYYDGLGNASHIGINTGLSGQEMVDIAVAAGNTKAVNYNYGDGAIHSSSSRQHVTTSKFSGKTISNGGWNMVGLWNRLDFGDKINAILKGSAEPDEPDEPDTPDPDEPEPEPDEPTQEVFATVWAESGSTVNIRKAKSTSSKLVERVPVGATVKVIKEGNEWSKVCYTDKRGANWYGFMMSEFLKKEEQLNPGESYIVCVPFLTKYQAEALIAQYPGSWMESGVG